MGWLIGPLVTVLVTAVIGTAALLSVVINRKPTGGALERVNNNTATPQDMQALQGAGQDFVRSAQILRAGGSLIGSRGPIPNIGGGASGAAQRILQVKPVTGGLPPLPSATDRAVEVLGRTPIGIEQSIAGVVSRAIGSVANQASQPPLTRDNPSVGRPSQPPQGGSPRPSVDLGQVNQLGGQSQDLRPGGVTPETSGSFGGEGAAPIVVDPNWAAPTGPPQTPGTDQPPPVAPGYPPPPGAPGYPPPDAGQEPYPPQPSGAGTGADDCPPGKHREQPGGPCH
jgi:hypothetical protein